jgi:hypothetical protein
MRNDTLSEDDEPDPTELDRHLQSLSPAPVPDDLLTRCLNTIEPRVLRRRFSWTHSVRWPARVTAAAAAVVLICGLAFVARPRAATAAHFLQAARAGWTEVPACHRVVAIKMPSLSRTMESWFVRGKGGRQETRSGDKLIGVVVNNGRWEFRWDVAEHLVAAWSTAMLGRRSEFDRAGLIQNSEELVRWAETHKADIHIEPDTLSGRKVRKVTLQWPGPAGAGGRPQVDTVWFDSDSLRPLKQRSDLWDGGVTEATFDYPEPENVPADLLHFQLPADVTLEINDPDLGRQVYSEPRATPNVPTDPSTKGADR